MLKNYLKIAWRNLTQHKSYTLINLFGLAVGMACCILIALYTKEELSFDTFHENADRIVAIGTEGGFFDPMLATPYPLADALVEEIPGVEKSVRLVSTRSMNLSRDGQEFVQIENARFSEPSFFEIFSFNLISGTEENVLSAPNSIVLGERVSRQLFGNGTNPLGQTLQWQRQDSLLMLEVTGVMEDIPKNSSLQIGALISLHTMDERRRDPSAWQAFFMNTYALLQSSEYSKEMPARLQEVVNTHYEAPEGEEPPQRFFTVPLKELHLSELTDNEGFTGNRAYLYLFGSVALFILVIACVNYINLATARTSLRSKEVGVRKSLGALRRQVAAQFMGESIMLSTASYLIGIVLVILALPWFNQLFGTELGLQANSVLLIWLLLAAAGVGLVAGAYPALYLSGFSPVAVLRKRLGGTSSGGALLRKVLVVGQFAIALILIISSLVVYNQLEYTRTKNLGFKGEQVAAIELPNREAWRLRENIKNTLASHSGIRELSMASGIPGSFRIRLANQPEGLSSRENVESNEPIIYAPSVVDYDYLDLLDLEILAGRNFSPDLSTDRNRAFILNRTAAEKMGWTPEEAVGKPFSTGGTDGEVIAVVENFHIQSFRAEIEPVLLQLHESENWFSGGYILARLAPEEIGSTMDYIEQELANFAPNSPFNYEFLDDKFDAMYRTERRLGNIIALFTVIAILIACLGLYGLAAFSSERRTKEIGIRKVLGATVSNIVGLLSKDFMKLVLLGFAISVPVAWYAMNRWLQDFAYRIEIGPGVFAIAGIAAVLIALATVSWQAIQAALANPVESLRSE